MLFTFTYALVSAEQAKSVPTTNARNVQPQAKLTDF
jgi:hypothetical protein